MTYHLIWLFLLQLAYMSPQAYCCHDIIIAAAFTIMHSDFYYMLSLYRNQIYPLEFFCLGLSNRVMSLFL